MAWVRFMTVVSMSMLPAISWTVRSVLALREYQVLSRWSSMESTNSTRSPKRLRMLSWRAAVYWLHRAPTSSSIPVFTSRAWASRYWALKPSYSLPARISVLSPVTLRMSQRSMSPCSGSISLEMSWSFSNRAPQNRTRPPSMAYIILLKSMPRETL